MTIQVTACDWPGCASHDAVATAVRVQAIKIGEIDLCEDHRADLLRLTGRIRPDKEFWLRMEEPKR